MVFTDLLHCDGGQGVHFLDGSHLDGSQFLGAQFCGSQLLVEALALGAAAGEMFDTNCALGVVVAATVVFFSVVAVALLVSVKPMILHKGLVAQLDGLQQDWAWASLKAAALTKKSVINNVKRMIKKDLRCTRNRRAGGLVLVICGGAKVGVWRPFGLLFSR